MGNTFCDRISGESCTLVQEKCFKVRSQTACDYLSYYKLLTEISEDTPPIARKTRENTLQAFLSNWKRYAQNPLPGIKGTTAFPFERELRATLKSELSPFDVSMSGTGKAFLVWENIKVIVDGLAKKEGFPISIFSFKTWLGDAQIRESFAYAYLSKTWLGQRNIRVYIMGYRAFLNPWEG